MPRVLIVEDDSSMAVALQDGFSYEGFDVKLARDGAAGLKMASESHQDLIVLDVMLPKLSGLDVCKRIRRQGSRVPVIMLTARGQEIDKVLGLKTGAEAGAGLEAEAGTDAEAEAESGPQPPSAGSNRRASAAGRNP